MGQMQSKSRQRSYRFEIRMARNNSVYLTAKEYRVRDGKLKPNWIMFFEEDLGPLVRTVLQLNEMLNLGVIFGDDGPAIEIADYREGAKSAAEPKKKSYSLDEIRQIYPRHGMAWDEAEDDRLTEKFEEGAAIEDLAEFHERKPSAIVSRLKKLGLVEEETESSGSIPSRASHGT